MSQSLYRDKRKLGEEMRSVRWDLSREHEFLEGEGLHRNILISTENKKSSEIQRQSEEGPTQLHPVPTQTPRTLLVPPVPSQIPTTLKRPPNTLPESLVYHRATQDTPTFSSTLIRAAPQSLPEPLSILQDPLRAS